MMVVEVVIVVVVVGSSSGSSSSSSSSTRWVVVPTYIPDEVFLPVVGGEDADGMGRVATQAEVLVEGHLMIETSNRKRIGNTYRMRTQEDDGR